MSKIILKDYIGWSIGILAILVAIIFGIKNQRLENKIQEVHNSTGIILQNINSNVYVVPKDIKDRIEFLYAGTGPNQVIITNR